MIERDDEQLDLMLRDYFSQALEGRQGRSETHFRQYLKAESKALWRQRSFLFGAFVSAMAASVAVLWATPIFHSTTPVRSVGQVAKSDSVQPVIERVVSSSTSDEGIVMLDDDTPVRVFHRQEIEQTRWFDEHEKMQAQQITPRDDLLFVKLVTY